MRATHSVLESGARSCFYVISSAGGLTDADRERLAECGGNEHLVPPAPYDVLMEEAGFVDIEVADVTHRYVETLEGWKAAWEEDAEAFIELVGEEEFARRMLKRTLDIGHAEDGLVRRQRVCGVKP